MAEMIVVGEEEFTLGFELVGIKAEPLEKFDELISKNSNVGIIVISQKDYDTLSIRTKNIIDKLIKPIVVILSQDDIKGGNLRDAIIRALGVDLLNK